MKWIFMLCLFSFLPTLAAQNDSILRLRLGAETLVDIPLKSNEKIVLQSFYNEQPLWIRIVRQSAPAQVAIIGIHPTQISLDKFIAIYPERKTQIQLDIFCTIADSDMSIEAQRQTWQRQWHPLSYQMIFFTTLTLWMMAFFIFIVWRINRYYKQLKNQLTLTEFETPTCFEQVSLLLERLDDQKTLSVPDKATLYVLILSCWNMRYNWGGHQRLIKLYPFIMQNPPLKALHTELEGYLFSNGKTLNTHALLESCRVSEKEQTQGEKT